MNPIPPQPLNKADLRRRMRAARDAIPAPRREAWSRAITQRLLAAPEVAAARSVFVYLSVGSEVDTRGLVARLLADGRIVAIPRVLPDGTMTACRIDTLTGLIPDRYGIPGPPAGALTVTRPDVALVPGLAFTPAGHRLGLGAGYYDRWLAEHPGTRPLGLCFPPQLLADGDLPVEAHDVPVARVITPGDP